MSGAHSPGRPEVRLVIAPEERVELVLDLFVCARRGKLGCVIGDALDEPGEIRVALGETTTAAYRARALADERRAKADVGH